MSFISQPLDFTAFWMADHFVDGVRKKMKQIANEMKCEEDKEGAYDEHNRYDMNEVLGNRCTDKHCSHPLCKEVKPCEKKKKKKIF